MSICFQVLVPLRGNIHDAGRWEQVNIPPAWLSFGSKTVRVHVGLFFIFGISYLVYKKRFHIFGKMFKQAIYYFEIYTGLKRHIHIHTLHDSLTSLVATKGSVHARAHSYSSIPGYIRTTTVNTSTTVAIPTVTTAIITNYLRDRGWINENIYIRLTD